MKEQIQENGISYTLGVDGLYYPDLKFAEDTKYTIGKYGYLRKVYLKNHRPGLYTELLLSGKMNQHLHEVEAACMEKVEMLVEHMKTEQGGLKSSRAKIRCCGSIK